MRCDDSGPGREVLRGPYAFDQSLLRTLVINGNPGIVTEHDVVCDWPPAPGAWVLLLFPTAHAHANLTMFLQLATDRGKNAA
jgi:hypothetical protein